MNTKVKRNLWICFYALFAGYVVVEKLLNVELTLSALASLAFCAVAFFIVKTWDDIRQSKLHEKLFCTLFALLTVVCESFWKTQSFDYLFGNVFCDGIAEQLFSDSPAVVSLLCGKIGTLVTVAAAFARTIGTYCLSVAVFCLLKKICQWLQTHEILKKTNAFLFGRHTFLKVFLFFILLWSPYMLIKFPGAVTPDATWQIAQFFGDAELTNHHPVFATWVMGGIVWIGAKIWNFKFGVFLLTLAQSAAMAGTFAYAITTIRKFKINPSYATLLVIAYAILPYFGNSATSIVKDTIYCSLFVAFLFQVVLFVRGYNDGKTPVGLTVSIAVLGILTSLFRNNGIYAVAPTVLIAAIMILVKKGQQKKLLHVGTLLLTIVVFFGYNYLQKDVLQIKQGSIGEALAIPFQQTARYVRDYGDEVTEEEKEAIDAVLDYDNLAEDYNPTVSDPIKAKYKGDNSKLLPYFKVWLKMFFKHPICYLEATLEQNYYAFYLDVSNMRSYKPFTDGSGDGYAQIPAFESLRTALLAYSAALSLIPAVSLLVNPVLYVWIFIYLIFFAIAKKDRKSYVILIPLLISLLVVIAAPAIKNQVRYLYPITWSIPLILPYFMEAKKKNEETVIANH